MSERLGVIELLVLAGLGFGCLGLAAVAFILTVRSGRHRDQG